MVAHTDVKTTLTGQLRALHLPAFRESFEELARHAEQETLSYEQYLLELSAYRHSLFSQSPVNKSRGATESGSSSGPIPWFQAETTLAARSPSGCITKSSLLARQVLSGWVAFAEGIVASPAPVTARRNRET